MREYDAALEPCLTVSRQSALTSPFLNLPSRLFLSASTMSLPTYSAGTKQVVSIDTKSEQPSASGSVPSIAYVANRFCDYIVTYQSDSWLGGSKTVRMLGPMGATCTVSDSAILTFSDQCKAQDTFHILRQILPQLADRQDADFKVEINDPVLRGQWASHHTEKQKAKLTKWLAIGDDRTFNRYVVGEQKTQKVKVTCKR